MTDFPKLPLCPHEAGERWESGRRRCKVAGFIGACGLRNPKECPFTHGPQAKANALLHGGGEVVA